MAAELGRLVEVVKALKKPEVPMDLELTRHQLGSINLDDLDDIEKMNPAERKAYLQDIELLWSNRAFQSETKKIMRLQLEFIACMATDMEQVAIGRGTINGIDLLRERVENLHLEYKDLSKLSTDEDFDEFEVKV